MRGRTGTRTSAEHNVRRGSSPCKPGTLLSPLLFFSLLFSSILFYSILGHSLLFYSILFYSILFYSIPFYRGIPPSSPLYSILLLSFCALLGGYGRHVLRIRRSNRQRNASVFDERGAVHEAGAYALVPAPLPSASISSSISSSRG